MIEREHFQEIARKYGSFASWAVWADQGKTPKSNIGDMTIFDLDSNPFLLEILNPCVVMVGLNFSRPIEDVCFINFHDRRSQGQDYKIRYAFRDTPFYGAYMTDILKDFEEKISGNVLNYLKAHPEFEKENVRLFGQEVSDLRCHEPLIIAFGDITYKILQKHFGNKYKIRKVIHYSQYINQMDYRKIVWKTLLE